MRLALASIVVCVSAASLRADLPPEVVAIQKAVQKVIQGAEPAIACILVSRSDKYEQFNDAPASEFKLGGFTPVRHQRFMDGQRRELIKRLDLANPETVPESYGSGVLLDETGLILTTYAVIQNARKLYVRLPGERLPGADRPAVSVGSYADIVAADARADLAVIRMITAPVGLKPIKFGDGSKTRKGDFILAMANPFAAGFRDGSPSAGWGMVSNLRRKAPPPGAGDELKRTRPLAQHATLMQTDARINLGCSGGAILNLDGEMIGLTTALAGLTGGETAGGYAIPIDAVTKKMIEILMRGEEIEYGFLGVSVDPDDRSIGRGAAIRDVTPGFPAARAGLRGGDVITSINGNPVRDQEDLFLHISAALAGNEAKIEVFRNGRPETFDKIRLAKTKSLEVVIASNRPKPVFGMSVDYSSTLSLDANPPEGVLVTKLETNSPAESKLQKWQQSAQLIVIAVNGRPVATPSDFYKEAAGKPSVTLDIVEASRTTDSPRQRVTLP